MTPERWDHIADLLNSALDRPPDERSAYLARACGDDAELHAILDELIAADDELGPQLEDGPDTNASGVHAALMGVLVDARPPSVLPDLKGARVEAYQVLDEIGRGGMGIVYKARDTRLERFVALKFLPPHLQADRQAHERFMQEARAVSAVDHPNVCTIYDIGETEGPEDTRLTYIAMAYYEGETLQARLAAGPLAIEETLPIAEQVLHGLAQAHRHGVIHRDVKPGNVMLTTGGSVKLVDFGVAKLAGGSVATQTGATPGTVAYMAPEQIRREAIGPPTDLWALGVMWYEMLVGRRPFTGETTASIIYDILEGTPNRLRDVCPDAPDALASIIDRLLSRSPEARYVQASDVLADLRAAVPGHTAPAETTTERPSSAPPTPKRKRSLARWIAVCVVALAAGWWVWAQGRPPTILGPASESAAPTSHSIAVLPFSVHGEDDLAYLREGLVVLLSTKLDGTASLHSIDPNALVGVAAGRSVSVFDPAEGRRIAARFGADQYVLGSVLRVGDGLQMSASLYGAGGAEQARAEALVASEANLLAGVDQLAQQLVASQLDDPDQQLASLAALTTDSFTALKAYLQGERALREGRFEEAIQTLQHAVAQDSTFALAWYRLARAAGWVGGPDGERINMIATDLARVHSDALPPRTQKLIRAYHAYRKGDPREAEQQYRSILATHPDDVETWLLLGETLFHNNAFYGRSIVEAREPFERALAVEPDNRELLVHLIDIAAKTGNHATLDTLTAEYLDYPKGATLAYLDHAYRALQTFTLHAAPDSQQVYDGLQEAGHMAVMAALIRVYPQLGDAEVGLRLSQRATATAPNPTERTQGRLYEAYLHAARGQWQAADRIFAEIDSSAYGWALIYRTLIATVPHAPYTPADLDALRADIARWNPDAYPLPGGMHSDDLHALKPFMYGLISVHMGDEEAARQAIRQLTRAGAEDVPAAATSYAHTIEAYLAWKQGRAAETLALLDAAERPLPFAVRNRSPVYEQIFNRFLRAEALRAEGRYNEALAWYAALNDGYYVWGSPYLAVASLRRAAIYDQMGDAERATDAYRHAAHTWNAADPAVRAVAEEARRAAESRSRSGTE